MYWESAWYTYVEYYYGKYMLIKSQPPGPSVRLLEAVNIHIAHVSKHDFFWTRLE